MTQEQLQHYLKGGVFIATYLPTETIDLTTSNQLLIGQKIKVTQNIIISPLISPTKYKGQHAFNSEDIQGWIPEEDLQDLIIIDEYERIKNHIPQYLYRMTYTEKNQLHENFGIGKWEVPLVVGREFSTEMDKYILNLSKPQASKIEKAVWKGESFEELLWVNLL